MPRSARAPPFTGTGAVYWLKLDYVRPGVALDLTTCGFDTDLSVFKGSCDSLEMVACDGDSGSCSVAYSSFIDDFVPEADTQYYIVLGGWHGATGAATVTGTYIYYPPSLPSPPSPPPSPPAPPPSPGSSCELAGSFGDASTNTFSLDIPDTSVGVGPPSYDASLCSGTAFTGTGAVYWLKLDDVRPGVALDLTACGFDTDLSVFKGSCDSLEMVACNGNAFPSCTVTGGCGEARTLVALAPSECPPDSDLPNCDSCQLSSARVMGGYAAPILTSTTVREVTTCTASTPTRTCRRAALTPP